jgi:hypothetical protein
MLTLLTAVIAIVLVIDADAETVVATVAVTEMWMAMRR